MHGNGYIVIRTITRIEGLTDHFVLPFLQDKVMDYSISTEKATFSSLYISGIRDRRQEIDLTRSRHRLPFSVL